MVPICIVIVCLFVCQESAAVFRERISDKYSRIRAVLDGDERLMMQMIDAEETYTTEWLEAQRVAMETLIKEADTLRTQSRQLLQETNNLTFLQVTSCLQTFVFACIVRCYFLWALVLFSTVKEMTKKMCFCF